MAKKKSETKAKAKEKAAEVIEIMEEDLSSAAEDGRGWSEELGEAGDEAKRFAKNLWNEGQIRRVVIRNPSGETVMNLPIALGALALFPPISGAVIGVSLVGSAVALLTKCKISVERNAAEIDSTEAA